MDPQICDAIENKRLLAFNYDGLPREIEPHAHGISLADKEVVRGYQTGGQSSSGQLGWRLWVVAKMGSLRECHSTFASPRPEYHQNDSGMKSVHCQL